MATKLFLRTGVANGISGFSDMVTTAGDVGTDTAVVNTAASGTEIQWTHTAGGAVAEWISGRVPAGGFTLAGTMTFSIWANESNMNANCGARARVFKRTAAGVVSEVAGGPWNDGVEFGTAAAEMVWTGTPTSTAFAEDDRLIVRYYITNVGVMATGYTCTLTYSGPDASSGDSFFQINENVAFKSEAAPSITPDNAAHAQTADSPSLAAKSSLTPANSTHDHTATSPTAASFGPNLITNGDGSTLTGWVDYFANAAEITLAAGRLRVTGDGNAAQFYTNATTVSGKTYRLQGTMFPHEGTRARMGIDGGTVKYADLNGNNVDFEFAASAATHAIIIGAGDSAAWVSNGEYAEFDDISIREVNPPPTVAPANAAHDHSSTSPTLAAKSVAAVNSATHSQVSTSPTLAAKFTVAVNSATHAQSSTSPTLAAKSVVGVNSSTHAHAATSPTLAAKSAAAVNNATHAQSSTSPSLAAKSVVAVNNAIHEQTATSPSLTVSTSGVAVDSSAHVHASTSPSLAAKGVVTVDSILHGHTASSPIIVPVASPSTISIDSAAHGQGSTSPSITFRGWIGDDPGSGTWPPETIAPGTWVPLVHAGTWSEAEAAAGTWIEETPSGGAWN